MKTIYFGNKLYKILVIIILFVMLVCLKSTSFGTDENDFEISEEFENEYINKYKTIYAKAKVLESREVYNDESYGLVTKMQEVKIKILDGEYKGKIYLAKYILSCDIDNKIISYPLAKDNTVTIQIQLEDNHISQIIVEGIVRQNYIFIMIGVFFLLILAIGGKQGLKAIIALVVTILLIYFITIKYIYQGYSPMLLSISASILIIIIDFLITGGINKKAITAMIGTSGGVICSGLIALLFGYLAKLTGGSEEAIMLSTSARDMVFNFRELLYAGIIISALGACMDIGMSISSALDELKQKTPEMSTKELIKSGMNIGKDVMATMTNTLILAYVGSSLVLILLGMSAGFGAMEMINKETIASEVIGALAATTGVVLTIPITTVVYSLFASKQEKTTYNAGKKSNTGKRDLKF